MTGEMVYRYCPGAGSEAPNAFTERLVARSLTGVTRVATKANCVDGKGNSNSSALDSYPWKL
jgi:hypothetical protein